jgi:hypothetical protein
METFYIDNDVVLSPRHLPSEEFGNVRITYAHSILLKRIPVSEKSAFIHISYKTGYKVCENYVIDVRRIKSITMTQPFIIVLSLSLTV